MKKKNILKVILIQLIFIGLSYFLLCFLIHKGLVSSSSDYIFHWQRLIETFDDISHFKMPQFNSYSNVPYGIATPTMYPWLSLIPSLMIKIFVSKPISIIYSTYYVWLLLGLEVSYFSFKSLYKNNNIAKESFLFAILYIGSSIPLEYVYNDGDFGELSATVLAPIAFIGWIHWIKRSSKWKMMTIGLILMMGCHLLSTIIMIVTLGILSIAFKDKLKNHLITFVKASLVFAGITSVIWIPILVIMLSNKIEQPITMLLKDSGELLVPDPIFLIVPSRLDVWTYSDLFSIVLIIIYWKRISQFGKKLFYVAVTYILANFNWLPWNLIQRTWLSKLQFLCRINFISHMILSMLLAQLIIKFICKRWYKQNAIAFIGILMIFILGGSLLSQWECTAFKGSTGIPISKHYRIPKSGNHQMSPQKLKKSHVSITSKKFFYPRLDNRSLSMPTMIHFGFCYDYAPKNLMKDIGEDAIVKGSHTKLRTKYNNGRIHFYLSKPNSNVIIPYALYNQQNYKVFLNGRSMNYSSYKHRLVLRHLHKGSYKISVQPQIMWYRYLTIIIAVLSFILLIIL